MENEYADLKIYEEIIKKYFEYKQIFEATGRADYYPNQNNISKRQARISIIAKIIIVSWVSLLGMLFIIVLYKELIPVKPQLLSIELVIAIYIIVVLLLIFAMYIYSSKIMYVHAISIDKCTIQIRHSKTEHCLENKLSLSEYNLSESIVQIKRSKRKNVDNSTSIRTPFRVFLTNESKREVYSLFAYDKCDLFSFILFLEFYFKGADAGRISLGEIKAMFYSSNFRLKMEYSSKKTVC